MKVGATVRGSTVDDDDEDMHGMIRTSAGRIVKTGWANCVLGALVSATGCAGGPGPDTDAGRDIAIATDAGTDVRVLADAGLDVQTQADSGPDVPAQEDVPVMTDMGVETGLDAGVDAGFDVGFDIGVDTGPVCSDGVVMGAETCDDRNLVNGDGCSSECVAESDYRCAGQPSVCTRIDDCAPNPCLNGGTCTDGVNAFTCQCTNNYESPTCSRCATGTDNCNGTAADGCEVSVQSNVMNCGACGRACPAMQICSNAMCQSPPTGQVPGAPVQVSVPHGPLAPAIADVNRDGRLDVLVANGESGSTQSPSGSLSVFHGNGDGTLRGELYYPGAPLSSNAVVTADVDGDGWLDAITVNGQTNLTNVNGSISVFRNAGASGPGTFGAPVQFTTGAAGSVHLCAGDFNGDGRVDIATTNVISSTVSVLLNAGAGGFGTPTLVPIPSTGGVQSTIACRDVNGDNRADVAVTSPASARLSVLLSQSNGTLGAPVAYTNALNGQTAGIAFGDADRDGVTDILSNGAAGAYVFFFKGAANGTFVSGVQSATGTGAVANSALGIVADDFNGDGKLDAYLLITTTTGGVRPMTGNGTGVFTAGSVVSTGVSPGLNAIAVGDLDRSGYGDLVLTNRGSNTLSVIPNGL